MNSFAKFLLKIYASFVIKNQKYLIFESGDSFKDNAFALYQYIKEHYPQYKRKYLVPKKEMKKLAAIAGVSKKEMLNPKNKLALYRYSLKSKAIFFSYINYWKKLKLTNKTDLVYTAHSEFPVKDCTKFYDYVLGPQENKIFISSRTEFAKELFIRKYPLMLNHNFEILGAPRNDLYFKYNVDKNEVLRKLGFENPDGMKIIISMTTFRHEPARGLNYFKEEFPIQLNEEDLDKINSILKENNEVLLIKLHHVQNGVVTPANKDFIKFINDEDIVRLGLSLQSLYTISDVMITDYSTAYLGFLIFDRKIIFVVADRDKYDFERGFTMENIEDYMPGEKVLTKEELLKAFENLNKDDGYKDARNDIRLKLVGDYKDQNCKSYTDRFLK